MKSTQKKTATKIPKNTSDSKMIIRLLQESLKKSDKHEKSITELIKRSEKSEKNITELVKRSEKNESAIDLLACTMHEGFARMDAHFEQIDKRFEGVDSRFLGIEHELRIHTERLERIERHEIGIQMSIDEAVHRAEFTSLKERVEHLEQVVGR